MAQTETVDIVIIAALEKEREALLRHMEGVSPVPQRTGGMVYRASVPIRSGGPPVRVVVLQLPGMGNVEAARAVTRAIDVWSPRFVVVTGILGGTAKGSTRLGDIVVPDQVVGYETGTAQDASVQRRFSAFKPAFRLIETARHLPRERWTGSLAVPRPDGKVTPPSVHFGPVASGEKIVRSTALVAGLRDSWPKLLGIEMEGYGVALAAYESESSPGMLLVKGICDWADPKKDDRWQAYAADAAASFTVAVLAEAHVAVEPHRAAVYKVPYSGKSKVKLCQRLSAGEVDDLADYFDIPIYDREKFPNGRHCKEVWEWLERRKKLDALPNGLTWIGRDDTLEELEQGA